MRVVLRIVSMVAVILITWVLIQNVDYVVDVDIFDQSYKQVKLPLVLLLSFSAGLLLGSLIMSLIALQYKAEMMKQRKREKQLMDELDSLRNLSIDDITLDEINDDMEKGVQLPIVDKPKPGTEENA